ncbi:hypothetical protein BH11PLA2_BH11PLA2_31570 [soil metagenome]
MKRTSLVPTLLFGLFTLLVLTAHSADEQKATEKKGTKKDLPAPSFEQLLRETKPASGFTATIFATPDQANYPVLVSAATDGTLFVSSDQNGSLARDPHRGRIFRLRDTNGDGRADEVKQFVKDIDSPRGLVWDIDRLYVLHPPHISVFIDTDGDGVADEEKILVKNVAFTFKDRPADHTSNGLCLGIDGWLYAAIGDFGFMEAVGTDGRKLQLRGGGVIRVRTDGTGLELFSYGTRNILEVAMSPLLDGFARDNTNDGGGWDVRFHHFTGLEDHGYPKKYVNFASEAIKPLADYGGGSGCGAAWIDDPAWPAAWNNRPYTCDWGRGTVTAHPVTAKGATFVEESKPAEFLRLPRPTDLDIDGAGRVYVSSWRGGQFKYDGPNVGYIASVVPTDWKPAVVPDFAKLTSEQLAALMIETKSQKIRQECQRRLLRSKVGGKALATMIAAVADHKLELSTRVAAIFFLQQQDGALSHNDLKQCGVKDPSILPWILRALTNDERHLKSLSADDFFNALKSPDARTRREALIGFTRLGDSKYAMVLTPLLGDEDPVIAHTAVRALAQLQAVDLCLAMLGSPNVSTPVRTGAARAIAMIHGTKAVDGLIELLKNETGPERRYDLLAALCRLYHKEGVWKGDSWGTRPDTRGPYYQPVTWEESAKIAKLLEEDLAKCNATELVFLGETMTINRIKLGDPLGRLIDLADRDSKAIPVLTEQLAKSDVVPERAQKHLIAAAETVGTPAVQAVKSLVRLKNLDAYKAALVACDSNADAVPILMTAPVLDSYLPFVLDSAGKGSTVATGVLLKTAASPVSTLLCREGATKFITANWKSAKSRGAILTAIAMIKDRSRAMELVTLAESNEPDAANAMAILKDLKLDPVRVHAIFEAKGPKLKDVKVPDAVSNVEKLKGEIWRGEQLFTASRCVVCHTVSKDQPLKGPYMGSIAKTYKRKDLAEAILLPSKTIAQGFQTNLFTMDSGKAFTGYVTQEAADKVTIRDINGDEITLVKNEIESRKKNEISMMPEGLLAEMTMIDFASLLDYLEYLSTLEALPRKGKSK